MASSTPHFTSPTSPEFAIDYPKLPESLTFRLPGLDFSEEAEASNSSTKEHSGELSDSALFADTEDLSPDSSFEIATPGDLDDSGTAFPFGGAEEEDEFEIDRTILRPAGKQQHHSKFDLSSSLAKLATRSTATLRNMSSFTNFSRLSAGSVSGDSDCEDSCPGITAPPASVLASRRPSVANPSPHGLSSPVSAAAVAKSLRRLASSLNLDCAGHAAEKHFEEAVDHYEKAWARDEPIEVRVERSTGTEALDFEVEDQDRDDRAGYGYGYDFGYGYGYGYGYGFQTRPDGIGIYSYSRA